MLSNLGAAPAARAAAELERLAKAESKTLLRDALQALEQEAASLASQIEAYLAEVRR
jgi:hypothetical protein